MTLPFELGDGRLRSAGRFNATTSIVALGSPLGVQLCTAQTILAYCRPDGSGEGGFDSIIYRAASGTANGLRLHIDHNAGSPRVFLGGRSSGSALHPSRNSSATITYGQWHHIGATWDGGSTSGGMLVYTATNGSPLQVVAPASATNGAGTAEDNAADPLTIGNRTGSDRTFNGLIGYVARWNRVLSLSELMLAQQRGPLAVPHGLIMCWTERGDIGPCGLQTSVTAVVPANARPTRIGRPDPLWVLAGASGPQTVGLTQVNETDTAQALTAVPGAVTAGIAQVVETGAAQDLTPALAYTAAITAAEEVNTAQALTVAAAITVALGQVEEQSTAQTLTYVPPPGVFTQVDEQDEAQALTAVPGAVTVGITQVSEDDTAQALTPVLVTSVGLSMALEIDTAQAFAGPASQAIGQVSEADAAQALAVSIDAGAPPARYTISARARRLGISAKGRRQEIRK